MKRYLILLFIFGIIIFQVRCGGVGTAVLTGPVGDNILVIGGVLVENLTLDSYGRYETVESGIDVVIVGKSEKNGKEEIKGYQIVTDKSGYFCLENVPEGEYVIKGIRVMLEDQSTVRITNDWYERRSIYYKLVRPEQIIDFNVTYFPKQVVEENILNLGIWYFGLEPGSIAHSIIPEIENQKIGTEKVHNRPSPLDHYKSIFPESAWF